jgi:glycosyltransferase involved in cell wall biosynthesis
LLQIYTGVTVEKQSFCGSDFHIGKEERRLGNLFFSLKDSKLGELSQPYRMANRQKKSGRDTIIMNAIRTTGKFLVQSGLWELIFPLVLSPRIKKWLDDTHPDIVFCQSTDLSFMKLALDINAAYSIPICINITDDWVEHLYKGSFFSFFMTRILNRRFQKLIRMCASRFVISDLMAHEYQMRYGLDFEPLMQCDDPGRFPIGMSRTPDKTGIIQIVYSGDLGLGRWESLLELSAAIEPLVTEKLKIEIVAYAPFVPVEASELIKEARSIRIDAPPKNEDVPGVLCDADILFLPESFEAQTRAYTKLSVSTKAHLYMMSERPVLVYGPPEIGTVEYATREGWGFVVSEKSINALREAVRSLINDASLRERLVSTAKRIAMRNHDGVTIREKLRKRLSTICSKG